MSTLSELNIRKKLRDELKKLTTNAADELEGHLYIPILKAIFEAKNEDNPEFIDLTPGIPSYLDGELPRVHVLCLDETGAQNTVDAKTRYRSFDMQITVYLDTYVDSDGDEKFFKVDDREDLIIDLEQSVLEIDYNMVNDVQDQIEEITVFDLENVRYNIEQDSDTRGVQGTAVMQYRVDYVITYQGVTT